jgi:cytochrome c-type biogenesis protein CcmH
MLSRREFMGALAVAVVQTGQQKADGSRSTMVMPMQDDAYKPVSLPAKAGATASMTDAARDGLEHRIHCQCGCTLDIYTCRTTDFTCPVSPAMHKDVMGLVAGGYSADEIIQAFQGVYGDRVLMAPPRVGFNWAGYVTPFVAVGAGAVVVAALISRWGRRPVAAHAEPEVVAVQGTADEMRRLDDAIRRDDQS